MHHGKLLRDYNSPKIGACANSGYQALLSASAKLEPGDEAKFGPGFLDRCGCRTRGTHT